MIEIDENGKRKEKGGDYRHIQVLIFQYVKEKPSCLNQEASSTHRSLCMMRCNVGARRIPKEAMNTRPEYSP